MKIVSELCQPSGMCAAKLAALSLALSLAAAAAQQPQSVHLVVRATDASGAAVPQAYVNAQPSAGGGQMGAGIRANAKGEATLDLLPGWYLVSVDGCLVSWEQWIKVVGTAEGTFVVNAVLEPGALIECAGFETETTHPDFELLPASLDLSIPLREVKVLPVMAQLKRAVAARCKKGC